MLSQQEKQDIIFNEIRIERDFQDAKWGTLSERPHEVGAWLLLMQRQLQKAQEGWATQPHDRLALDAIRQLLALGVACFELHGMEGRNESEIDRVMPRADYTAAGALNFASRRIEWK